MVNYICLSEVHAENIKLMIHYLKIKKIHSPEKFVLQQTSHIHNPNAYISAFKYESKCEVSIESFKSSGE